MDLTFELSFTLSGSLKLATTPFVTEESQVYVCLNDGIDHNCLVARSKFDSGNQPKLYGIAY